MALMEPNANTLDRESNQSLVQNKKNEIALREALAHNRQLMNAITSILIRVNADHRIMHWNHKAHEVFGLSEDDVTEMALEACQIQWDLTRVKDGLSLCEQKKEQIRLDDLVFQRQNQSEGFLGITLNPILDEDDTYIGCLLLAADITERKKLETQLLQAQKLESIGQLAAGIAHEINTPTQYIGDNIRFLNDSFRDLWRAYQAIRGFLDSINEQDAFPCDVREVEAAFEAADLDYLMDEIPLAIQQSLEGIERVSTIVKAMKEFSHPGSTEKMPTDINHAIENTLTVARNEWKYIAVVEKDFEEGLPLVPCLPGEFNQVMLNLVTNAAHAIQTAVESQPGKSGLITIRTRKQGDWVEIRLSDNGCGIQEGNRNRIFDPFFTTKDVGKGTGQGLTIAYNVIVDKHGGKLSFESEVDKGTTFIILLPIKVRL